MNNRLISILCVLISQITVSMEKTLWKTAHVTIVNESTSDFFIRENPAQLIDAAHDIRQLGLGSVIEFTIKMVKPEGPYRSPRNSSLFTIEDSKSGGGYNIFASKGDGHSNEAAFSIALFSGNSFVQNATNYKARKVDLLQLPADIDIRIVVKNGEDSSTIQVEASEQARLKKEKERLDKLEADRKRIEQERLQIRLERSKLDQSAQSILPFGRK